MEWNHHHRFEDDEGRVDENDQKDAAEAYHDLNWSPTSYCYYYWGCDEEPEVVVTHEDIESRMKWVHVKPFPHHQHYLRMMKAPRADCWSVRDGTSVAE